MRNPFPPIEFFFLLSSLLFFDLCNSAQLKHQKRNGTEGNIILDLDSVERGSWEYSGWKWIEDQDRGLNSVWVVIEYVVESFMACAAV